MSSSLYDKLRKMYVQLIGHFAATDKEYVEKCRKYVIDVLERIAKGDDLKELLREIDFSVLVIGATLQELESIFQNEYSILCKEEYYTDTDIAYNCSRMHHALEVMHNIAYSKCLDEIKRLVK